MNTPTKTRGVGAGKAADLTYWEGAARMIASVSTTSKIVVEKSTVPVKTAEAIEKVRSSAWLYAGQKIVWQKCSGNGRSSHMTPPTGLEGSCIARVCLQV